MTATLAPSCWGCGASIAARWTAAAAMKRSSSPTTPCTRERLDKLEAADTYGLGALLRLPVYGGIKLGGWYGWSFDGSDHNYGIALGYMFLADLAGPRSEQCAEQAPGRGMPVFNRPMHGHQAAADPYKHPHLMPRGAERQRDHQAEPDQLDPPAGPVEAAQGREQDKAEKEPPKKIAQRHAKIRAPAMPDP